MASENWLKQNFDLSITAAKGLSNTAVIAIIMWAVKAIQTGQWNPTEDIKANLIILATAGFFGALVAGRNVLKNRYGIEISKWFGVIVCVALLSSCNTVGPAISGKTEIETKFSDVVGPGETQNTQYYQKLKAPAGVEVKDLASMSYVWEDGKGNIAVSSDRSADTMGQAELLKSAFEANSAQVNLLLGALIQAAGIASPIIGQKLQFDATQRATDSQNDAVFKSQILQALTDPEVLKAWQKLSQPPKVKAPKPADAPLDEVTLPQVGTN